VLDDVYENTDDGKWYRYNGSGWEVMTQQPAPNANGAISVGIVAIPGGVAAQEIGIYEGTNPWPVADAGAIGMTGSVGNASAAQLTAAKADLDKAPITLPGTEGLLAAGNTMTYGANVTREMHARSLVKATAPGVDVIFLGSATDSAGNVYVVGYRSYIGLVDFGNGVTVSGGSTGNDLDPRNSASPVKNAVIVKYNSAGKAQ
jgi:hypothetical protein